jgi:hypothetical protein
MTCVPFLESEPTPKTRRPAQPSYPGDPTPVGPSRCQSARRLLEQLTEAARRFHPVCVLKGEPCPSGAVFTSGQTLEKTQKGTTLSHFSSSARRLSGPRARSASPFTAAISDTDRPFFGVSKASWRTRTGRRPTISADVHCLPVSLLCAALTRPLKSSTNPEVFHVRSAAFP